MKQNHALREIAKIGTGLVLGDIITLWWFVSQNLLPVSFLGVTWTQSAVLPGLLFDLALLLILIHYGWHVGKMPAVREKTYFTIAGVIFGIVALLHLVRLFFGNVDINIFGWDLPVWVSWVGVVIAGYLSYMSFSLVRKLE